MHKTTISIFVDICSYEVKSCTIKWITRINDILVKMKYGTDESAWLPEDYQFQLTCYHF